MLDSRPKGRGFEPHRRHCLVSLSKNINPSLVLVQPRKTRHYITERLLMGRKESNQTNKQTNTDLGLQKTLLNPPVNGKMQVLFKAFECFSSTFQVKFYFQGLFKTVLYIQVHVFFKPVQTLMFHLLCTYGFFLLV